jgi:hypothetical protein
MLDGFMSRWTIWAEWMWDIIFSNCSIIDFIMEAKIFCFAFM